MNCIDADSYGLIPNDPSADNFTALTNALNDAAIVGNKVCLPTGVLYFSTTLQIPAGVIVIGTGTGSDPLNTSPGRGSVLAYTGNQFAIELSGHNSGLRDLNIDNKSQGTAAGAIRIFADGELVESLGIDNVQIFSFLDDAIGLKLEAINSGGIAYCSFSRLRIRHASTAIHIIEDSSSFINSNRFYDFVFSGTGTGCKYGIRVNGGNNNVFYGAILEPRKSEYGHIVIEEGKIDTPNIRIEANEQEKDHPVIHFHPNTYGSVIEGFNEGKGLIDEGDNFVNTRSNSNSFNNPGINVFKNAAFKSVVNSIVPRWEMVNGSGVTIIQKSPEILENHEVIEITIPAGIACKFRPELEYSPQSFVTEKYDHASFGCYIKGLYNSADSEVLLTHHAQNPTKALVSSTPYTGDDTWDYLGLTVSTGGAIDLYPQIYINNSNNTEAITIQVTTPSYVFGLQSLAGLSAPGITSAGGEINGMISLGMSSIDASNYISGTTYIIIPPNGNYFEVTGTQMITRINHSSATRLAIGTVITLIFDEAGLTVQSSGYISLLNGNYLSAEGSSLTLISGGTGTWKEISRNV